MNHRTKNEYIKETQCLDSMLYHLKQWGYSHQQTTQVKITCLRNMVEWESISSILSRRSASVGTL